MRDGGASASDAIEKINLLHFFAPLRFGGGEVFMINVFRAFSGKLQ